MRGSLWLLIGIAAIGFLLAITWRAETGLVQQPRLELGREKDGE